MRSIAQAFITMRRSPYQALTALLMLTITFFVGYSATLFMYGIDKTLTHFEQAPQVIAFFELETAPSVIKTVEQDMQSKSYVTNTKLITQEQALDLYRDFGDNNPLLLELVTADFLPASLEVSGEDPEAIRKITADLDEIKSIEEVQHQPELVDQLEQWASALRLTGIGMLAILTLLSFLVITTIIALKATSQRHTISVMRVIGASNWYISAPYMFEGALYAILGSLAGWGLMYLGLFYLIPDIQTFLADVPVLPVPLEYFSVQLGAGTLIGIFFGSLAATTAVGRMSSD